eukprot:4706597-Alexandrium_andersonii.AAC.1
MHWLHTCCMLLLLFAARAQGHMAHARRAWHIPALGPQSRAKNMRVWVRGCMRACVSACVRVCLLACVHVCVCACVCLWTVALAQGSDACAGPGSDPIVGQQRPKEVA